MLSDMQKNALKTLSGNDPDLVVFLKEVSKYILAPKIIAHLIHSGITGSQLKQMIAQDRLQNPERFVKEMNMKINGRVI